MCDPGTALVLGAAAAATGAVVGGISKNTQSRYQATVAEQTGQYVAAMAESNALFYESVGEYNAKAAIEQARQEEQQFRIDAGRQLGSVRVKLAQGGTGTGSAMDVLADQAIAAERESQVIKYRGAVKAQQELFGAEVMARRERQQALEARYNAQAQATAYRSRGKTSLLGGFFGAGSSLLNFGLAT